MPSDFDALALTPELLGVVAELGYQSPTQIQVEAIPLLLAGKDLRGQSKTGSGKTAAFSLPILQNLDLAERKLQALILCPTRELASQVARELRKLGRKHQGLAVLEIVGGQPVRPQIDALARGVHIAVGTPGRLLDHLKRETLKHDSLKTIVLDEADRMLDMGFGADVEAILKATPKTRQTVLFSATYPNTIESLSKRYQRDAAHLVIKDEAEEGAELRQLYVELGEYSKLEVLYGLFAQHAHQSALIFCNFKATVSELEHSLSLDGFSVDRLDGDLEQYQRDQVLAKFRNQSVRILIATDVAGRGIDVEDLDLVVNYELPAKPNIYVHRIGRTARAGKAGVAISIVPEREVSKVRAIEAETGVRIQQVEHQPAPDVRSLAKEADMQTIQISGGRKDKIRPGDILGALTGQAGGLRGDQIGKIEIQDRLSYVAVSRGVAKQATKSINAGRIKRKRFRATLVA